MEMNRIGHPGPDLARGKGAVKTARGAKPRLNSQPGMSGVWIFGRDAPPPPIPQHNSWERHKELSDIMGQRWGPLLGTGPPPSPSVLCLSMADTMLWLSTAFPLPGYTGDPFPSLLAVSWGHVSTSGRWEVGTGGLWHHQAWPLKTPCVIGWVPRGCCNTLPQPSWLQTRQIYSRSVLEIGSPKEPLGT